ncbi:dienelactone hydrolase family protein [Sphingomonas cavernae]|nr:dienelactone hydrolase family protein [Sphingomonas cavernae]
MMQPVTLAHEGAVLNGELFLPKGTGVHPGVLVMHNALGLGAQVREVAADLAERGFAALATDMFGAEFGGDPARAGAYFAALQAQPDVLRSRVVAWHDRLAGLPDVDIDRTAAIGYCFGGFCVLELARSGAAVKAAVSFHGLLTTSLPATPGVIRGEVAAWCGGQDPFVPSGHIEGFRAEMATAGASSQITVFASAAHSFTDRDAASLGRPGVAYDALADRVSWAGTLALLDSVLRA